MSRRQPTPPPAGVVKPDPPPEPPRRDHGIRFVHQNDPPHSLPPLSVGRVHLGAHAGLPEIPVNVQPPPVKPPAPDLDADLLAALRSALAAGVGVEELLAAVGAMIDAKVRGLPASEFARPWTYCADSQPAEAGRYEVAYVVRDERRRAFALGGAPRDLPPVWSLPGISGRVAGAYAWRPVVEDLPPLRSADRAYLATQGVPAEWLRTPEED